MHDMRDLRCLNVGITPGCYREMAGVACTHMAMGWIGGVLCSRVVRTRSCFRGPEGRLVYVGQGPAYVMWLGIPGWVISVRIIVAPRLWRLNSLFIIIVNK